MCGEHPLFFLTLKFGRGGALTRINDDFISISDEVLLLAVKVTV